MPRGVDAARVWKAVHVNPRPRKGGKLPGAGRKKLTAETQRTRRRKAEEEKNTIAPARARDVRVAILKGELPGQLTKAEIDLTLDETRVLDAVRASDEQAGRKVDA